MKSFYMIWNPEGRPPTHKHASFTLAKSEAHRLAKANPGQQFFILNAIGMVEKVETVYHDLEHDVDFNEVELPF